jgi:transcription-repair coupling factor (superfamily II helicase)
MNLTPLLRFLRHTPEYEDTLARIRQRSSALGLDLPRAARVPFAVALAKDVPAPVLLVAPRSDRMLDLLEELPAWGPQLEILPFPEPNPLFYEPAPWGRRVLWRRARALAVLGAGDRRAPQGDGLLIVTTARAAMTRTIPEDEFRRRVFAIELDRPMALDDALRRLLSTGYRPSNIVLEPGQVSRRGGILDLWSPLSPSPARVELEGDRVASIRAFEPETQRSRQTIDSLLVPPAREAALNLPAGADSPDTLDEESLERLEQLRAGEAGMNASFLRHLPPESVVLLDDRPVVEQVMADLEEQAVRLRAGQEELGGQPKDRAVPYLTQEEMAEAFDEARAIDLGYLSGSAPSGETLGQRFSPGPRFAGQASAVMDHVADRRMQHDRIVLVTRQSERLLEIWTQADPGWSPLTELPGDLEAGSVAVLQGGLSEGWVLRTPGGGRLHLLTDAEIFGWVQPHVRPRPRTPVTSPEVTYSDLRAGDWVVHVDHGIGRFAGLVDRVLDGLPREFLHVIYADGDELFVPIHQADRIMRYVGADGLPPQPSRLGGADWERSKGRVRSAVEDIARDLLQLYARRMTVPGHAFSPDGDWQRELEASFPYAETDDQVRALQSVKRDMEAPRPMDRLICGDVGYGKTEVALRAAFKAVMDNRQVAVLVPTTVLAQQHLRTFRQRLAPFPVEVEMLSRFRTPDENRRILERLTAGEVDIVVGTHRLLQRDVRFRDLGLVIIDEEQRFGVTHKETLKRMRTEVDVLTLTATPIPRTLYLALTGVRDISMINTPPDERLAVTTHVGPYNPALLRQAVLRELDRGGQVFLVHNRVHTIDAAWQRFQRLVPEARAAVAHGQMPERELAQVMESFTAGEIDVLVCSSIIESGLDIPNANTLVVEHADAFGLAQLYQLRGRVGRGAARAYAYLFRHARHRSTEEGLQRLEVLAEHSDLGAGYSIAMRDLEMRGAGDILGTRQHGHIATVGFHLYTRLLGQVVQRLRAETGAPAPEGWPAGESLELIPVTIELPLASSIPAAYVSDRNLRLQLYRRLADLRSERDLQAFRSEIRDRFGDPPVEVDNLLFQLGVKLRAIRAGVQSVVSENGQILIQLGRPVDLDRPPELGEDVRWSKRGAWVARASRKGWQARLLEILSELEHHAGSQTGTARS